jgi:hypothetical protein
MLSHLTILKSALTIKPLDTINRRLQAEPSVVWNQNSVRDW